MDGKFELFLEMLPDLYGPQLLRMEVNQPGIKAEPRSETQARPETATAPTTSSITWRPKPTSKMLFVLHQAELKDKALGELLKKIVESIGISFDSAGFGIMKTAPALDDFADMPNPIAVVFDETLRSSLQNPIETAAGRIFFSSSLQELSADVTEKKALWEFLKSIKSEVQV